MIKLCKYIYIFFGYYKLYVLIKNMEQFHLYQIVKVFLFSFFNKTSDRLQKMSNPQFRGKGIFNWVPTLRPI